MLKKRYFLPALASLLLCSSANTVTAESMNDAVVAALNHHPSVEAARANRDAYTQERKEQRAGYFPSINIRSAAGRIFGDNSTTRGLNVSRGQAYSYYGEGAITMTQMLFDGFDVQSRVGAAEARKSSAVYNIADVRENLALRTVLSYLDIMRGRAAVAKIAAHETVIKDYRGRITNMVDEGAADESLSIQSKDIQLQLENTLADVRGQLDSAIAEYAELTGHIPEDPMKKEALPADMIFPTPEDAVAFAEKEHPALQAASMSGRAISREVEAEKSAFYPDVTSEFSYLKSNKDEALGGEVIDAKALVRMNWDFSVGGGIHARIDKTRRRYEENQAQYKELKRQIERDIRIAYADMETSQKQLKILRDRKKVNGDLFNTYETQFEAARVNLLQLLQANNALFNSELALLNGEYRLLASQYAALASTGRLQEALDIVSVAENE